VVNRIRSSQPDVVLVGLGAPKQELFIDQVRRELSPAVLVAVGAGIDFAAGVLPRAPRWMSLSGLEWLYRLAREPRRLFTRYLIRDPGFVIVVLRSMHAQRRQRPHEHLVGKESLS
jgi:N-acetylglucosaminyldiphosphoundecaprenol N-acetyl-beta-D-mannosaminyltransferase